MPNEITDVKSVLLRCGFTDGNDPRYANRFRMNGVNLNELEVTLE